MTARLRDGLPHNRIVGVKTTLRSLNYSQHLVCCPRNTRNIECKRRRLKQQVPIRLPLVCTRGSLRAGSPLRSLRFAPVGMTLLLQQFNEFTVSWT